MNGIVDLNTLLKSMSPRLGEDEFVFCSVTGEIGDYQHLNPKATFRETEGLTLVLTKQSAVNAGLNIDSVFKMITLGVHSSLEAVGLTAAVANKLTEHGISANVIAAYYHDHIFVPVDKAGLALEVLYELT